MNHELPSAYNPKETEPRIYKLWEESGFFNPDNLPVTKSYKLKVPTRSRILGKAGTKSYCIVVPPPNITGSLHMGHALNAVIQDILIRKKRMEGYKALWLPGTDHAGIATQNIVEKELKKENLSRHDLGREKFLQKIEKWKEKYGTTILDQFKKLGCSMDWSRTRFTMDEEYQKAVSEAFLHYHRKGMLYKAERVINWCVRDQTSLSDLELEYKEEKTNLYYIRYPFAENSEQTAGSGITVATTRPETMLGDSAVAVNPKDDRYKNLIGKKLLLPIQNREIPVIADEEIDMTFGTGAVKVTPAHDLLDARTGEKHNLPVHKVIGLLGKMTEEAGALCAGLKTKECRKKVVHELEKLELIEKVEEYTHNIAVCYRCGEVIEPLPSLQWFLKMDALAKKAMDAVKNGEITFHPKQWENVYFDWLKNIRDWNVSRQIWWGHKIPLESEEDVLDTWFSSALWPFAALGWPQKTKELKTFYPTAVLSTARDIINLWVARMIFSGYEFMGKKPFSDVIIHATILTKEGKRMSKSLGTGIDPMDLIETYGADATRFGIIWQHLGTQDIHWAEEHVLAGKKFANKIWNIARFIIAKNGEGMTGAMKRSEISTDNDGREILARFDNARTQASRYIDEYNFGQALHALYNFAWHDFADIYIEQSKAKHDEGTKHVLAYVFINLLKLLHPFLPFITEEIWSKLPREGKTLLLIERWPE